MAKSSIHIQGGKIGFFSHNSRESKTVNAIFKDESNYISCDNKTAIKNFKDELELRTLKYLQNHTSRTKLHSKTLTHLSAIVNFNKEHTPEDIKKVCDYLEKTLDTKVIQFAMHRDEGHINSKNEAIKNYHAHIEFMGLDSEGNSIRRKLDKKYLINLQNEVANILQMERGKNYTQLQEPRPKRLDTYEYKKTKEKESKVLKEHTKNIKNKFQSQVNEYVEKTKTEKQILKEELAKLKEENKLLRTELQNNKSERTVYAELEALNQKLKSDIETGRKNFDLVKQELETFKSKYLNVKNELNLIKCNELDLKAELEEIKLDVYSLDYKNQNNEPVKNIDVVKHLQKKVNTLQNENKSLISDKRDLEHKVITLEDKINSRANMSDYEQIKKENEELKKENASLKEKVKSILAAANEKIKSLFKFKIYNDVKLGYDRLNHEDWEKECEDDIRLENKYQREIKSELIEDQEETNREIFKNLLEEAKKEFNLDSIEKLNENLRDFIEQEKPVKKNIDNSQDFGNHR